MGAYLGVRLGAWANYHLGYLTGPPLEMPYPILWPEFNQERREKERGFSGCFKFQTLDFSWLVGSQRADADAALEQGLRPSLAHETCEISLVLGKTEEFNLLSSVHPTSCTERGGLSFTRF